MTKTKHEKTTYEQVMEAPLPICVLASAGTGKSTILINKIIDCVKKGFNPKKILVCTFTVDATNELSNRIPESRSMTIGTIHSVSLKILRTYSSRINKVISENEVRTIIFEIFKKHKIKFDNYAKYTELIGLAKNTFPDYYKKLYYCPVNEFSGETGLWEYGKVHPLLKDAFDGDVRLIKFAQMFQEELDRNFLITFDDMALKACELMSGSEKILNSVRNEYHHVFLDEAQDVCPPQIELVRLITEKSKNLFVVGDVKQTIYMFRASTSYLLDNFSKMYGGNIFTLPMTFRCSKEITSKGNRIAKHIDGSITETVIDDNGIVKYLGNFPSQKDESNYVIKQAIKCVSEGKSTKVLYRVNSQSLTMQLYLLNNNIPYSINEKGNIFNSKEGKMALYLIAFMEFESKTASQKLQLLSGLSGLFSKSYDIYNLRKDMEANSSLNPLVPTIGERTICPEIRSLHRRITTLSTPKNIVMYLLESGAFDDKPNAQDNILGIAEFVSDCKDAKEVKALVNKLAQSRTANTSKDIISLSTIHGAKGLEADVVFVTGISQGMSPHARGNPSEELNLIYVAVTRAKKELYLSSFEHFGNKLYMPSGYLKYLFDAVERDEQRIAFNMSISGDERFDALEDIDEILNPPDEGMQCNGYDEEDDW